MRPLLDSGLATSPTAPFGDLLDDQGRLVLPGLGAQDPVVLDIALTRLRRRDPAFDAVALARLASDAMVTVERAWSSLDPQPSRSYLAPPLWASHRARMELYVLHGRRNVIDDLTVHDARVVAVDEDGGRERVTVRIRASSTDYDVDGSGALLRGDVTPRTWQEDWVLERASSALSRPDGGLLARRCPACGAPITLDADGLCAYCHAAPTDASRDWVVVGVADVGRQEEILRAVIGVRTHVHIDADDRSPADDVVAVDTAVPALGATAMDPLAALHARDPSVDVTAVVSAARAAFVAVRSAWHAMDAAAARPVMSDSGVSALADEISSLRAGGLRRVADDPLVDSVTVVSASADAEWETATVRVSALLVDADVDTSGAPVRGDLTSRRVTCDLVLRRRVPAEGGDVTRCRRCGAPLRATVTGVCDFCREIVAGGGTDWVLDALPRLVAAGPRADLTVASGAAASAATPSPLTVLRGRDPTVNEAELIARARECFYAVETAMGQLDPSAASGHVTPGFLAAQRAATEALRAENRHRVLAFIDISSAHLVDAASGADGDRAVVRIDVTGEDCIVDDATGAVLVGSSTQRAWREDWTLLRPTPADAWLVDSVAAAAEAPGAP